MVLGVYAPHEGREGRKAENRSGENDKASLAQHPKSE